jgi:type III pantothenate kinase
MILAIDIGNSTIGFGFVKKGRVERVVKIENEPGSELVRAKLANFLESAAGRYEIRRIIICSVVPDTTKRLKKVLKKHFDASIQIIGRHIKVPVINKYRSPRQVGKDRLLCAFAAKELYGAPAVVIDLGTAITFDGVSAKGEYLGGAIIPGLRLSAEALFEKTALLPRVKIEEPANVIGRSTEESIQSGIFHGYGALCDGMVDRLGEEMGCRP